MRKMILLNGPMESGKDKFIELCENMLGKSCLIKNLSTINPVNAKLMELGWDGVTKDKVYRDLASKMKQAWNHWDKTGGPTYRVLQEANTWYQYYPHKESKNVLIFIHSREEQEFYELIDIFREGNYNYSSLFIMSNRRIVDKNDNPSDYNTLNMCEMYEYCIDNNGTIEQLEQKAIDFLIDIGLMKGE
jgi:hypothetical protein